MHLYISKLLPNTKLFHGVKQSASVTSLLPKAAESSLLMTHCLSKQEEERSSSKPTTHRFTTLSITGQPIHDITKSLSFITYSIRDKGMSSEEVI